MKIGKFNCRASVEILKMSDIMTGNTEGMVTTDSVCKTLGLIDTGDTTVHIFSDDFVDALSTKNFNCSNMTYGDVSNASFFRSTQLPANMQFGGQHVVFIAAYSCFFFIAAVGNLTVFITLFRNRSDRSRVNMFIMHLSIADLIVTFIMLPLEIGWNATVEWLAGNAACRILMFFRTFGLYLSSFVLVVISLDRYFAILHPLSLNDADKRGKIMLCFAWIFSIVASAPQVACFVYLAFYIVVYL